MTEELTKKQKRARLAELQEKKRKEAAEIKALKEELDGDKETRGKRRTAAAEVRRLLRTHRTEILKAFPGAFEALKGDGDTGKLLTHTMVLEDSADSFVELLTEARKMIEQADYVPDLTPFTTDPGEALKQQDADDANEVKNGKKNKPKKDKPKKSGKKKKKPK